jgi:hypothetical protein
MMFSSVRACWAALHKHQLDKNLGFFITRLWRDSLVVTISYLNHNVNDEKNFISEQEGPNPLLVLEVLT